MKESISNDVFQEWRKTMAKLLAQVQKSGVDVAATEKVQIASGIAAFGERIDDKESEIQLSALDGLGGLGELGVDGQEDVDGGDDNEPNIGWSRFVLICTDLYRFVYIVVHFS